MSSNIPPTSNKNKELQNRLMILEKFIELKTNECAYYRTKVHLMQMSSINSRIIKKNSERSSSEDISHNSITNQSNSIEHKHRRSSVPLRKTILKEVRNLTNPHVSNSSIPFDEFTKSKSRQQRHRNQNHYEEVLPHSNQKQSSAINDLSKDKNAINQILISYLNKHLQQIIAQDKNIQCNDNDFYQVESSSKSPHTVLMIRLPRRFVKSLIEQQKTTTKSKLKVHISSELLSKLFQSTHLKKNHDHQSNKFTIQSQFGAISACIKHEDSIDLPQSKAVHAKAEVKNRLPTIRHIARTKSDDSDKNLPHKHRYHRKKKRHVHKSSTTSHGEIDSKKSSLTNVTQSIETIPSLNQISHSISVENNKIKKNKRN